MSWRENSTNIGLLILRLGFGGGMAILHGWGKVAGGHMPMLQQGLAQMGFPVPVVFAWAAALSEFVGGFLIAIGYQTRVAALFLGTTMGVAAFVAHAADPIAKKELALAYLVASAALFFTGAGKYSFDKNKR